MKERDHVLNKILMFVYIHVSVVFLLLVPDDVPLRPKNVCCVFENNKTM